MAASENDVVWAVGLAAGGAPIGVTGIHRIDWQNRHGWTEIVIGERSAWGLGYATEALRLAVTHAFREFGFEKVLASVYTGNQASLRLVEKVGFRPAGLLRHNAYFDGRWHDEWLGEILRDEWKDGATDRSRS